MAISNKIIVFLLNSFQGGGKEIEDYIIQWFKFHLDAELLFVEQESA